jgi:hypothetical protein
MLPAVPAPDPIASSSFIPPAVPGWARPRGPAPDVVAAAFHAGAALTSLDNLVRADPPWAGAWRQRLALTCAAAAVAIAGRTEDEAALRDAWHLRADGADPGPAGAILAAWRRLAARSPGADPDTLRAVTGLLGLRWSDELAPLAGRVAALARSGLPAPIAAAALVREVDALRPDAELLGWWLADQVVALQLRWPLAVPLLIAQAHGSAFRAAGRRVRPSEDGFERAVCLALAEGASAACRLAADLAPRAARLEAVAPTLRAKGAGAVVRRLLDDDAVPGTLQTTTLSRWGARRLFERLHALDAVRELSGRAAFRLYGL